MALVGKKFPNFSVDAMNEMGDTFQINVYEEEDLLRTHQKKINDIFGSQSKYKRSDFEKLIKYIFFMYDKKTPMVEHYSDVNERKEQCAIMAGYEDIKKESVLQIFSLENEVARELIFKLLKHQKGMAWSALVTNCELFWQYQREILSPIEISKDDKNKLDGLKVKGYLAGEVDVILNRINSYTEKLFGDDEDALTMLSPTSPESMSLVDNV